MDVFGSVDYKHHPTLNRFRQRRAQHLRAQIARLRAELGRPIVVLDVGGRPDYWMNVGLDGVERVVLLNLLSKELDRPLPEGLPPDRFSRSLGDARDLGAFADQSVDLVHSNSVIEHVGRWDDMRRMADEMRRVGLSGWVQTPAWTFPVEPHFHTPFMHWMAAPMRARMMSASLRRHFRRMSLDKRRLAVESVNLLSRREVAALFPDAEIYVERCFLLSKSYTARWMPAAAVLDRLGGRGATDQAFSKQAA
jgi:hypothetical protein